VCGRLNFRSTTGTRTERESLSLESDAAADDATLDGDKISPITPSLGRVRPEGRSGATPLSIDEPMPMWALREAMPVHSLESAARRRCRIKLQRDASDHASDHSASPRCSLLSALAIHSAAQEGLAGHIL
jgi:hypothetical protein